MEQPLLTVGVQNRDDSEDIEPLRCSCSAKAPHDAGYLQGAVQAVAAITLLN